MVDYALQDADEPEVQRLRAALRAKEQSVDRQEEELRTCRQRINHVEVSWQSAAKQKGQTMLLDTAIVVCPSLLAASCKLPCATVQHRQDIKTAYSALSLPIQHSLNPP